MVIRVAPPNAGASAAASMPSAEVTEASISAGGDKRFVCIQGGQVKIEVED